MVRTFQDTASQMGLEARLESADAINPFMTLPNRQAWDRGFHYAEVRIKTNQHIAEVAEARRRDAAAKAQRKVDKEAKPPTVRATRKHPHGGDW